MGTRLDKAAWDAVMSPRAGGRGYWHLEKANNAGVCWCRCARALVAVPDQLACPWCGCGWLLCCCRCGKAFTYAKPVRLTTPLRTIIEMDYRGRGQADLSRRMLDGLVRWMRGTLATVGAEGTYVYLDGHFLPAGARDVRVAGMFGDHAMATLPHARELRSAGALRRALGNIAYWELVERRG